MSDGLDVTEMGRQMDKAFSDAAEAMRRFAEVWNEGAGPRTPLVAAILSKAEAGRASS